MEMSIYLSSGTRWWSGGAILSSMQSVYPYVFPSLFAIFWHNERYAHGNFFHSKRTSLLVTTPDAERERRNNKMDFFSESSTFCFFLLGPLDHARNRPRFSFTKKNSTHPILQNKPSPQTWSAPCLVLAGSHQQALLLLFVVVVLDKRQTPDDSRTQHCANGRLSPRVGAGPKKVRHVACPLLAPNQIHRRPQLSTRRDLQSCGLVQFHDLASTFCSSR